MSVCRNVRRNNFFAGTNTTAADGTVINPNGAPRDGCAFVQIAHPTRLIFRAGEHARPPGPLRRYRTYVNVRYDRRRLIMICMLASAPSHNQHCARTQSILFSAGSAVSARVNTRVGARLRVHINHASAWTIPAMQLEPRRKSGLVALLMDVNLSGRFLRLRYLCLSLLSSITLFYPFFLSLSLLFLFHVFTRLILRI